MTEKLFDNSLLLEFEATVVSVCEKNGKYLIELDRSAFAPEGGGQPSDIGSIGEASVADVVADDNNIFHICNRELTVGTTVLCKIDKKRRMRHIQNHSGEHIVSGILYNEYGFNNVGFHLGSEDVTMDVDGEISKEMLRHVERLANEVVAKDLEINIVYPAPNELEGRLYRSKLDLKENVRIVVVEGLDACACCAPHVSRTGQIGMIKLVSCMRYKGGTRIHLKCGFDALEEFNNEYDRAVAISNMISVPRENIAEGVKKLNDDVNTLKREIYSLKQKITDMKISSSRVEKGKMLFVDEDMDMPSLRALVAARLPEATELCAAFSGNDDDGYTFVLGYEGEDFSCRVRAWLDKIGGSGGGKAPFAQGKAKCKKQDIEALLLD